MREITTLYQALLHSASNGPESIAIIEADRRWTYHELLMATDRAADMFWELGLRKGDTAAIVLRNCAEFLISQIALAKIGAVAVPINFMITRRDEIRFILSDSHTKAVITSGEFAAHYLAMQKEKLVEHVITIETPTENEPGALDFWVKLDSSTYQPQANNVELLPEDTATLLYTSGTTGHPKGVIISHSNLLSNTRSACKAFRVSHSDVFICLLPMFHTFAFTTTALLPLLQGCSTVIVSHITPAKPWLYMMGKEGVTLMGGVPQIFSLIAKEAKGLKKLYLQYWAFRSIRFCFSGAAPLSSAVHKHFEETLGIPLLEGYGLTETSPVVSANRPHLKKSGSVGRPLPDVQVKIMDDNGNTLPPGVEGEICVLGPNVTSGYHDNVEATRDIFTPDGWLKTGDIGVLDEDGFLFIRDRKKDMIIVKGLKVFSAQVEMVIHEHPAVGEAAVIGIPDGKGEEFIKCFIVLKPGMHADKAEIMKFLKEKLDPYKRPRDLEIVESLPKNSLNKILKRKLRQAEVEKLAARSASARVPVGAGKR